MFKAQLYKYDQNIEIGNLNELSKPLENYWKSEEQVVDIVRKQMQ